jgi:hypothetical protein
LETVFYIQENGRGRRKQGERNTDPPQCCAAVPHPDRSGFPWLNLNEGTVRGTYRNRCSVYGTGIPFVKRKRKLEHAVFREFVE